MDKTETAEEIELKIVLKADDAMYLARGLRDPVCFIREEGSSCWLYPIAEQIEKQVEAISSATKEEK